MASYYFILSVLLLSWCLCINADCFSRTYSTMCQGTSFWICANCDLCCQNRGECEDANCAFKPMGALTYFERERLRHGGVQQYIIE
ncbi:hypothetical protein BJ944DRAFT_261805 [Cunninghamella echinulata]|nr:hypothetical protein BJ944DRAFT_261805 [Cunninghamella echinulata]